MKKYLILLALTTAFSGMALAGGLLTNTNQSVHFLRNPARDASTDIDAVYSNPAGLTWLEDGFHFSFSNQSAFQTRTITSSYAPYNANAGNITKTFEGESVSPVIPSIQLAYKVNKFVLSGQVAVVGGGGKIKFSDGLPLFESPISLLPISLTQNGLTTTKYSLNSSMEGHSYIIGFQVNGTYQLTEALSLAVGLRLNSVSNGYKGYLKDIKINPIHPLLNPTGAMISAHDFFTAAGMTTYATATADKNVDVTQKGWGISPIIGINYHLNKVNFAAKYEFRSNIDIENDTKVDGTGMYPDKAKIANDIPAWLSVGTAIDLSDKLKVSAGYHHFFDSDAKMAGNKQEYIDGGINEILLGAEYALNDKFSLSCGLQNTATGVTDDYQSDLSYSLNSISLGLGGVMKITSDLKLNVGYFTTFYEEWGKTTVVSYPKVDVYDRTNRVVGIGLDYSF
jgi:long-chain fatty acid transport protein